jgi:hypothetical protein
MTSFTSGEAEPAAAIGSNQPERFDEFVSKISEKCAVYKESRKEEKNKIGKAKTDLIRLTGRSTEDIEAEIQKYKEECTSCTDTNDR